MSFTDIDIEQVYELYNIRSPTSDPELSDATLVSDMRATCPIDEIARVAARASKSPVYRFQVWFINVHCVDRRNLVPAVCVCVSVNLSSATGSLDYMTLYVLILLGYLL